MNGVDFESAEVVAGMPVRYLRGDGESFPADLTGATIVFIGTLADPKTVMGGGLVIDYRPASGRAVRRAVFAFNESGMWVEYQNSPPGPAAQDSHGSPGSGTYS